MRHDRIRISDRNKQLIAYSMFCSQGTNRADIERMKRILYQAIERELTDRQRMCLVMYFLEGKKMKDIGAQLGLSKSTVSRHIKAAETRLRRIAQYY